MTVGKYNCRFDFYPHPEDRQKIVSFCLVGMSNGTSYLTAITLKKSDMDNIASIFSLKIVDDIYSQCATLILGSDVDFNCNVAFLPFFDISLLQLAEQKPEMVIQN